jgi:hypothetical protein
MAGELPPTLEFIPTLRRFFQGCRAARYRRTHISRLGVVAITAMLAACHASTYDGSIPWPDGPWSLTVANYAPYVITVMPWKGGPAKSVGCGTSAVFTVGAGGAPPLPWDVVVHGATGDVLLDQQTVQGSPPQEVDVETSGAAMRDDGGSLSFPGNVC